MHTKPREAIREAVREIGLGDHPGELGFRDMPDDRYVRVARLTRV